MSPALASFTDMPEHLRTVVAGIFKKIDDRVFRPIQEASNLDHAMTQAAKSFEIFTSLWPAVLGALLPWMQDNPERLVAMGGVVADVWTSEEARRSLGDDAVSGFAAAQDARVVIAHAILKDAVTASPNEETMNEETMNEETIVHRCLVADFAILFGLFFVHRAKLGDRGGLAGHDRDARVRGGEGCLRPGDHASLRRFRTGCLRSLNERRLAARRRAGSA